MLSHTLSSFDLFSTNVNSHFLKQKINAQAKKDDQTKQTFVKSNFVKASGGRLFSVDLSAPTIMRRPGSNPKHNM